MAKQKLTKRQMQSIKTKNKIYKVAIELMEKKGFGNITIEEISKKAKVSVGAFYHYYNSKEDILCEIFNRADEYFEHVVAHELRESDLNSLEQIVVFFKSYAKYNVERGLENVSQLYNTKNKFFIARERYMITLLDEIVSEGQKKGEIIRDMAPESITDYLFTAGRGVIIDWCIHEAGYDLEEAMEKYMSRLVTVFSANFQRIQ
jgi:TetR/AcrR family fatty acid metabolism transcriptional regulator